MYMLLMSTGYSVLANRSHLKVSVYVCVEISYNFKYQCAQVSNGVKCQCACVR